MNSLVALVEIYFLLILDVLTKKENSEFSSLFTVFLHNKINFFLDLSNACIEMKSMLPDGVTNIREMSLFDMVKGILFFRIAGCDTNLENLSLLAKWKTWRMDFGLQWVHAQVRETHFFNSLF